MSRSLNRVELIGRIGKDPSTRYTQNGTAVSNFSMATDREYKDSSGNRVKETEWHNIVCWAGLAEVVEKYLHKGDSIYISGRIQTRKWRDKEGQERYTTEAVAEELIMLGGKSAGSREEEPAHSPDDDQGPPDDDIPF